MIYVLIVVYNSKIRLDRINNISKYNLVPIIFDNSIDEECKKNNLDLCKMNDILYHTMHSNIGLSKAYNFIIKKYITSKDWIVLLDDDTDVNIKYFKNLNKIVSNSKYISFMSIFKYGKNKFGPKIIINPNKYKVLSLHKRCEVKGYLIGINSCSLISGLVFNKVGMFNENLFLDYIDVDFALRLALNKIETKSINMDLIQHFFSKEKNNYKRVKDRLAIQKHDAKEFYSSFYLKGFFRKKYCYLRDILKFIILYSRANNIFWFIPLLFVRGKK